MKFKRFFSLLALLSIALFFTYCDSFESETGPETGGDKGILTGLVKDFQGNPIGGVSVTSGGASALTDANGEFVMENTPAGDNTIINFAKSGYVTSYKTVEILKEKKSYVEAAVKLVSKSIAIDASTESNVSDGNAVLTIPANSLVDSNGDLYTGDAMVDITYFDPTADQFSNAFPGDFMGVGTDGQNVPIASFGFIDVEIKNGQEILNMKEGATANLKLSVPSELAAKAPDEIPLWYFDKNDGQWKEYSLAAKNQSGAYEGELPHFSTINLDMKVEERSQIEGKVVDHNGNPLARAWIKIEGVDFARSATGHTDENGYFKFINIMADAKVKIFAAYGGFYSDPLNTMSPSNSQLKNVGNIEIFIDPNLTSGWEKKFDGSSEIKDLKFVDANTGFALQANKGILKTTDGGKTWALFFDFQNLPNDSTDATKLCVIDAQTAYLIGNMLFKSTDGCANFTEMTSAPQGYDGLFINANVGWVYSYQKLWKTVDGGQNWDEYSIAGGQEYISTIYFIDENTGFYSSYNGLKKTIDGGQNWTDIDISGKEYEAVQSMCFVDGQNGWLIMGNREVSGGIFNSNDGGDTWTEQEAEYFGDLSGIFFVDANNGWAVGSGGTILHTIDGGQNWETQFSGSNDDLHSIYFTDKHNGCISGGNYSYGSIFYTETGGSSN